MIRFERFTLGNGLTVLVNEDASTPLLALNILYKVGARDEDENKTGFAHLFEHLMFGGSVNIPGFDEPLERAGGENNAFTNNDFTNYYMTLPAQNAQTAFWLESDRMAGLAFSDHSLEVQRKVVVEEFKQSYLNYPYGDAWLKLRPLAYRVHPYRWNTIGKDISHIEQATMDDVRNFFGTYYVPGNAILALSGNLSPGHARELAETWFGTVPERAVPHNVYPAEPAQDRKRVLSVSADVPGERLYKAYHCCGRTDDAFYATDLLADILAKGHSSRLYKALVRNRQVFTDIQLYHSGDLDKSLFVVQGKVVNGVSLETAEAAVDEEMTKLTREPVPDKELKKASQMAEAMMVCSEIKIAHRALNLAFCEMLGDAGLVNHLVDRYRQVTADEIMSVAQDILREENASVLYYRKADGPVAESNGKHHGQ